MANKLKLTRYYDYLVFDMYMEKGSTHATLEEAQKWAKEILEKDPAERIEAGAENDVSIYKMIEECELTTLPQVKFVHLKKEDPS